MTATLEAAKTREGWLGQAAALIADRLLYAEDVPPIRISVGFPGGRANRQRTVGQCWSTCSSEDGVNQIFISPIRGEADTVAVLATVLHEMIHAVDDCQSGHRGNFVRMARAAGLKAPWTCSTPTEELVVQLTEIAEQVGPFPHATLAPSARPADTPAKQGTRQLKVVCPDCGYTLRTTRKWLEVGLPTCACGTPMEEAQ